MKIAFFGDSLTAGMPGASYFDVLCKMFPEHELLNYGRGGDSVIGAYERVSSLGLNESFDMAFLWIGVNDVFVKASWTFPYIRRLLRQPWAKSADEFKRYYRSILEGLHYRARQVNTVPPLLVGEDAGNLWNRELENLSAEIKTLSAAYTNIRYIDLRTIFRSELTSKRISNYVARGAIGVAWDVLLLRSLKQIDQRSSTRGLHYTLDGVHLNSQGAELAAGIFAKAIQEFAT
jgi:lysophospholipase L1-like esterase